MNAGKLDRIATLRRNFPSQGRNGAAVDDWQDVGNAWVSKADTNGNVIINGGREAVQVETMFEMRWRSDVVPAMRIVLDGREYDLTRVDEIGRRDGLRCYGKVRAA